MGTFMRPSWRQYALCVPVSGLLYYLINVVASSPREDSEVPYAVIFVIGTLVQSLGLMLGVYLARRKAKRNSYEA
jgi:hypothetical protein